MCESIGTWGARWLEVAPEHLHPYVVLWAMSTSLRIELIPDRRIVVRFDFTDVKKKKSRYWLVLERREGEVCLKHPGFEEDLFATADSEWFANWHMGRVPWSSAVRSGGIQVEGRRDLARVFPTWNGLSHFAHVKPAERIGSPIA